jgi:signal transduction histidine kinase
VDYQNSYVFFFIAIIRTITFVATGIFINMLVTRLREQSESLRQANANLGHYASTLEQLTVSRERNRLARELHDTLAHSLTALSVSLETVKAYFDIDKEKTRELIDKSLDATRQGVYETRRALKALRASSLEDMGLALAVQRTAESAASRFNLNLKLDLQSPMPSLSPDVEQTIYRIAQESIENIVNHSYAKNFSVHLANNGHTTLTIQDDGIGFDSEAKGPTGHFGLVGMHERAELAGGMLKIESEKGKGTKVVLTI